MVSIIIVIAIYLAIFLTSPFITIFHELGHALAHIFLTKPGRVDIYIGSYHDKKTKLKFKIWKLHFYIKPSFPFFLNKGMCQSNVLQPNYTKKIIILLAGPIFSFLVALFISFFVFGTEMHGAIKLYFFSLIIFSFISMWVNLQPREIENTNIDNDGKQLIFTWRIRKVYSDYVLANDLFLNGDYVRASEMFLSFVTLFPFEKKFSRPLITSLLMIKKFEEAEGYLVKLTQWNFSTEDYLNFGYIQSVTDRHELAIENYKKALTYEPNNLVGLNNLGYELILKEDFIEAEETLNKSIKINPEFSYSYNSLGYLKILTGHLKEGKYLIDKSILMDSDNAYAYKHLGIYYLKLFDKEQAIFNLNKALELDKAINVQSLLLEAELL